MPIEAEFRYPFYMIIFRQAYLVLVGILVVGCNSSSTTPTSEPTGGSSVHQSSPEQSNHGVKDSEKKTPEPTQETKPEVSKSSEPIDPSVVTEKEMGLPYYPGSVSVKGADMKVEADEEHSFKSVRATRATSKEILDFYRNSIKNAEGDESTIVGKLSDGRMVAILTLKVGNETHVQISVSNSNLIKKN